MLGALGHPAPGIVPTQSSEVNAFRTRKAMA